MVSQMEFNVMKTKLCMCLWGAEQWGAIAGWLVRMWCQCAASVVLVCCRQCVCTGKCQQLP
jgi:hypothetical protein